MFAAATLGAIDSATKPLGEACSVWPWAQKYPFSILITQQAKTAAEDKVAGAATVTRPTL